MEGVVRREKEWAVGGEEERGKMEKEEGGKEILRKEGRKEGKEDEKEEGGKEILRVS